METSTLQGLINNSALLLSLAILYDLAGIHPRIEKPLVHKIATGLILGLIGMALMITPLHFGTGIQFDTRSVLISVSALFFGVIPVTVLALITAAFRMYLGGAGAWVGIGAIATSAGLGILWRHLYHKPENSKLTLPHLFALGLVTHCVMLAWMLLLPGETALRVLSGISLPVLVLFPVATVVLGKILMNRNLRRETEENRSIFFEMLNHTEHIAVFKDRYLRYILINPAYTRLTGHAPEAVIGKTDRALFSGLSTPEQIDVYMENDRLALALHPGETLTVDEHTPGPDGTMRTFVTKKFPVFAPGGTCIGVGTISSEMTERLESEQKYQTLFREMLNGFALHEIICNDVGAPVDYRFLAVNPAFERMTGLRVGSLVGRTVLEVLPDTEPYWIETYGRVALTGTPVTFENFSAVMNKHFQVTAFRPAAGQFACIFEDITDQTLAREKLNLAHEKLLTILDSIDSPVYVADMAVHEILFMNKRMVLDCGENRAGEPCYQVIRNQSGPCDFCTNDQLLDPAGTPTGVCTWHEHNPHTGKFFINHDRAIEWIDGRMVRLHIGTDITELKNTQELLHQAQKMESIGTLAGGIAHDFNNILFPIIGLSELMLEDLPPDSPEHLNLQEILKAGKRGRDMVQQILSFSRQSSQSRIPVYIQHILKEVFILCRSVIPSDIEIIQNIQKSCGPILADPTRIHQIAMNLITNAYHAVEATGGTITIQLEQRTAQAEKSCAVLTISDTGCGIDPAIQSRIFDPYFTTKAEGKGTGLGLSTVYAIVRTFGGDITVVSEPGKGAAFVVTLPIRNEADATTSSPDDSRLPTGTEHILLIDDEKPIIKLEQQMLTRLGYRTTCVPGSDDALDIFTRDPHSFDLIITDMNMPRMNGWQLATALMKIRPDVPIILCTGHYERVTREQAESFGFKGYLQKPVSWADLALTVRQILDAG